MHKTISLKMFNTDLKKSIIYSSYSNLCNLIILWVSIASYSPLINNSLYVFWLCYLFLDPGDGYVSAYLRIKKPIA